MNIGVVCEFNPFHNGHAYLLKRAKEISGGNVVCAMSGNFVQRGEYAFADKYTRAKWAIEGGADIVFENPFPFSCATAEKFALGAVSVLVGSGLCDALCFGCEEEASQEALYNAAEILLDKDFALSVKKRIKENKNLSFALAREKELEEKYGKDISRLVASPNLLLAIEYAKACLVIGKRVNLYPIKRQGSAHDGAPVGEFSSASTIRGDASLCEKYCPEYVALHISKNGYTATDNGKYYSALCHRILFSEAEDMVGCAELPHEYALKLKKAALENDSFEDFFESIKAKHMTDAKLRRMLIYLLTDVKEEDLFAFPKSAMLLGVSDNGAKLIRKHKKSESNFAVLSKISDIKKLPDGEKTLYEKQMLAEKLFEKLTFTAF